MPSNWDENDFDEEEDKKEDNHEEMHLNVENICYKVVPSET